MTTTRVRSSDVCVYVALRSRMLGNTQGCELGARGRDVRILYALFEFERQTLSDKFPNTCHITGGGHRFTGTRNVDCP